LRREINRAAYFGLDYLVKHNNSKIILAAVIAVICSPCVTSTTSNPKILSQTSSKSISWDGVSPPGSGFPTLGA
jgi:hypothetical protein